MKGLLIKDWKLLKNQGRFFIVIIMISILISLFGSRTYSGFTTSYLTFALSMFILSTLSYDNYDNGMAFLLSLPISRKIYVKEKYLFALFLTFGFWLIFFLIDLLVFSIRYSSRESLQILCQSPVYLALILLFLSYSIPLHLKFESEKGRMMSFGILGLFSLGIFCIVRLGMLAALQQILTESLSMIIGASAVFCLLSFGISYRISVKIMEKKEF
jgi:hypothetical protein